MQETRSRSSGRQGKRKSHRRHVVDVNRRGAVVVVGDEMDRLE